MNKKALLCMLCAVLALLLCCCATKESAASVGILEGLRFGMGPEEVNKLLGEPIMAQDETKRMGAAFNSYEIQLDGQRAVATITFLNNEHMNSVFVVSSCDSEEGAQELFEAWKSREIAAHGKDAWDFRDETSANPDKEYKVSMQSKQSAGTLTIEIAVNGETVQLEANYTD